MRCPHCRNEFHDRADLGGMTFSCPKCTGLFVVPIPTAIPVTAAHAQPAAPRKKGSSRGFYGLLLLVAGVVTTAAIVFFYPTQLPKIAKAVSFESEQEMIARVMRSVVTVRTPASQGSGFFVSDNQTIVTNFHVIEGQVEATVELADGRKATVYGFAAAIPGEDVAVLKLTNGVEGVLPLEIATAVPKQGSRVFTFGSPNGMQHSVADGIVSALRSAAGLEAAQSGKRIELDGACRVVQISAPISPGSSGGPLVSSAGEVVGVNTLAYLGKQSQSLNFAVSCEAIAAALKQATKPRLLRELPPSLAELRQAAQDDFVLAVLHDTHSLDDGGGKRIDLRTHRKARGMEIVARYPDTWTASESSLPQALQEFRFVRGEWSAHYLIINCEPFGREGTELDRLQSASYRAKPKGEALVPIGSVVVDNERISDSKGRSGAYVSYVRKENGKATYAVRSVKLRDQGVLITELGMSCNEADADVLGDVFVQCKPGLIKLSQANQF